MENIKRAGRPKSSTERVHVRLRGASVVTALGDCVSMLDAVGPSEVVRIAVRNYASILWLRAKNMHLLAGSSLNNYSEFVVTDTISIAPEDGVEKFTHISLSNGVREQINECLVYKPDFDISSLISVSIVTLHDLLKLTRDNKFLFYKPSQLVCLPHSIV